MVARLIVVLLSAGLIAVQIVRNAIVMIAAPAHPAEAAMVWGSHPAVEISRAMTQIAEAARDRRQVPASALATMSDAAVKEPLAPEPFLVRGVQAELAGQGLVAERAFEGAQWRDPRSLPAAYFLADRYFRTGEVASGLREVAALARLSPSGNLTVAPYLAAYARDPANWPALRSLFRANPQLADLALSALAGSAATAPAVMALADPNERVQDAHWLPLLLNTLAGAGQYEQAQRIWARVTRVRAMGLLYDANFHDQTSPTPFNWTLTSSTTGLAERQSGGRLHVLFYGQEDGILATQLLLLTPGTYRLSMQLAGDREHAHALNWSIWCDKADAPLSSISLDAAAARGWTFNVPARCAAQWLKLSGVSGEIPQQVDTTISSLKLERGNPSA